MTLLISSYINSAHQQKAATHHLSAPALLVAQPVNLKSKELRSKSPPAAGRPSKAPTLLWSPFYKLQVQLHTFISGQGISRVHGIRVVFSRCEMEWNRGGSILTCPIRNNHLFFPLQNVLLHCGVMTPPSLVSDHVTGDWRTPVQRLMAWYSGYMVQWSIVSFFSSRCTLINQL